MFFSMNFISKGPCEKEDKSKQFSVLEVQFLRIFCLWELNSEKISIFDVDTNTLLYFLISYYYTLTQVRELIMIPI